MESAPDVLTVSGDFTRIVVVRIKRGMDLLDGLKKAVAQEKIRNAAILSGVGSLTGYHVHAVSNTTLPAQNIYYDAQGPQDLLNVNGYVMDGRVHAHIVFSDNQKGLGGHLEPGTTVFTFAIITLGVLPDGADLTRFDEPPPVSTCRGRPSSHRQMCSPTEGWRTGRRHGRWCWCLRR
jgi:predicted DNA-binding protein with PD1-like motif